MKKLLVVLAAGLLLTGCTTPSASSSPTSTAQDTLTGTVTVFAAASLTETFGALADAFEQEHPGVTVVFNFGGSSGLATQIVEGAPADVFAAASGATMTTVTDAALTDGDPTVFVTNTLEIAVPAGNPGAVTGLADFADPDLSIAICAVEVPCGSASKTVFDAAAIVAAPDTLEQDVKAVLTKVELGEVDAGLVYRTDVLAAGDSVEGIEFPEASGAVGKYPIARLAASINKDAATAFIAYVLSPAGMKILTDAGFGAP
ncbi:MAG: molybdate ABC transporter substrate-binding protein [Salinibacterium sp.]|nr:molybdate ABC transporter substrate-binding protein [Salinibacterium sp.]